MTTYGKICCSTQRHDRVLYFLLGFFNDLSFIPPAFIRGLLENVGAEIDPIRLIRRIQNGLEIPGLKEALIKILQAFNLQISLLEGCQTILEGDSATLARKLQKDQTKGFYETGECTHRHQWDKYS